MTKLLSLLLAAYLLLKAFGYWVSRYALTTSQRGPVTGAVLHRRARGVAEPVRPDVDRDPVVRSRCSSNALRVAAALRVARRRPRR